MDNVSKYCTKQSFQGLKVLQAFEGAASLVVAANWCIINWFITT